MTGAKASGSKPDRRWGGDLLWALAGTIGLPAVALAALFIWGLLEEPPGTPIPEHKKPELYLLTSLPLLFGERFTLDMEQPLITGYLQDRYRLKAIDLPSQVPAGGTLLMVQPRALPAEELVALDRWVRNGGRLVLLADPLLEWPSERPLGDLLRPPPMFADTGLLGHWGLRLDAPDERGPTHVRIPATKPSERDFELNVLLISPGRLVSLGSRGCSRILDARYAECNLDKGRAIVVADADWLNLDEVKKAGGEPGWNAVALDTVIKVARD